MINIKNSLLISGALATTWFEQDDYSWPETQNFDACTNRELLSPDCLVGCLGNDYQGSVGCESPYYYQRKFSQTASDFYGDVICQTFCTDEILTLDDSFYTSWNSHYEYSSYPDSAQIYLGVYLDVANDTAFSYKYTNY